MLDFANWTIAWDEAARAALTLGIAVIGALVLHRVVFFLLRRLTRLSHTEGDEVALSYLRKPVMWLMLAIAAGMASNADAHIARFWSAIDAFVIPAVLGLLALGVVRGFAAALHKRTEERVDPVAARSRKTRILLISRAVSAIIIIITIGLILLGIPAVRDVGTGLLASAGLAALAVGAAAQPALKSLIAGIQMAITEPLRIGDMVVVDGHTGRVEEITMSFVIVRTWDERAIVVPTSTFLDDSFENWSRTNESLTGPVFLHLDPASDVARVRAEFERYIATNALWDGRNQALLMTEAYPESLELRMTVSAETIGELWNLRCAVREHMVAWLQSEMPDALIRHRLEVDAANERVKG
ncbi:MAG: mechanosensitive ion channel domain-containing protein [Alteripontixanthobacter sp.]